MGGLNVVLVCGEKLAFFTLATKLCFSDLLLGSGSSRDMDHDGDGLPSPPLDPGGLLASTRTASIEISHFFDDLDDLCKWFCIVTECCKLCAIHVPCSKVPV